MRSTNDRLVGLVGNLTNYERKRPDRPRWSLANMEALLARPGAELPRAAMVQVGGSKGKGTTALYLESLAAAAGVRTATYLSPHVQTPLERVRVLGQTVEEEQLFAALEPIVAFAREHLVEPSFFEVMTAAALTCFAEASVDLGILEVGLGGRLDATTAVPVDASIVTSIELEHTEILGDTVELIAGEKAHVIRPGRPAFTSVEGPALQVLEERARSVDASLQVLQRDFGVREVAERDGGFAGQWCTGARSRPFSLPGASAFEVPAFALAMACLDSVLPGAASEVRLEPVPRPALPGRCEVLHCADGVPLVLDGAHTVESTRALAGELRRRFGDRKAAVLFASAPGKRWRESLKCLLEMADTFVVTAPADTPMQPPGELLSWLQSAGSCCAVADSVEEGLRMLAEHRGVRVVTGSFYVVGAARSHLAVLGATPNA